VENPLFTPAERAALRYTEEMTRSSIDVPDEVFEELRRHFNTREIVDLTATIAMENMRAASRERRDMPLASASSGACAGRAGLSPCDSAIIGGAPRH
jgi:hypothetical protein